MTPNGPESYYFAYGSNMNPNRVRKRKMLFDTYGGGLLEGYRLAFNKRSEKFPGAASANVEPAPDDSVEGLLYRLIDPNQIETMDDFEGYPSHYRRELLPVRFGARTVSAWVYIANEEFITHGLKPARWYLEHLLSGGSYLSQAYLAGLQATDTLPDSDIEPE